jgi:all-trans-retinol dehydrogenase (NAD+)
MKSVQGKRVLITGSGQGLGKEIAIQLAKLGAEVIITDRDVERVNSTLNQIQQMGGIAFGYSFDVTSNEQILEVRDRLHRERGPLDILINNAGVVFGGEFLQLPIEKHVLTMEINVNGLMKVTHAFLPDLIAQSESTLVNIASASALLPLPWGTSYAASKWAVLGFTESLREELRIQDHRHIQVLAICPSYIATGMFSGAKPARGTWMLQPDRVATAVVRAIQKRRQMVLLPWTARWLHRFGRLLPRTMYHWFCRRMGVNTSMVQWKGHDEKMTNDEALMTKE